MAKPKTAKAVHPNRGVEAKYRKELQKLIAEMSGSVEYWTTAAYRKEPPKMAELVDQAQDASPSSFINKTLDGLAIRWKKRFDDIADKVAGTFVKNMFESTQKSFQASLKDAGWTVDFKMTPAVQDAFNASLEANISLIKSIPTKYLEQVEGVVMRTYSSGRDLASMTKELQKLYPITDRRAKNIAMDQSNKANAVINKTRQLELGITEAIWQHSHAGKVPRKPHVAADGKKYKIAKGMLISGEWIWPGEKINCFPGDMQISLNGDSAIALWRAPFNGEMVNVRVGSDLLKGTLNHPILTGDGWVPLGQLKYSDKIVCVKGDSPCIINDNKENKITTFNEMFKTSSSRFGYISRAGTSFDFYGDIPNGHVDEIIIRDDLLYSDVEPRRREYVGKLFFPETNTVMVLTIDSRGGHVVKVCPPGLLDKISPFLKAHFGNSHTIGLGSTPHAPIPPEDSLYAGRVAPGESEMFGDSRTSKPTLIERNNFGGQDRPVNSPVSVHAECSELFAKFVRAASDSGCSIFEFNSRLYEFRRSSDKRIVDFSGHVYTLQSNFGYYSVSGAYAQAKNCRCTSRAVLPF